jgi:uncharacterized protein involved in cysteine biosynthesis
MLSPLLSTLRNISLPEMHTANTSVWHSISNFHPTWPGILQQLPRVVLFVVAGVLLIFLVLSIVAACGFSAAGVVAGSLAAMIQSVCYGAAIPARSLFAICQSIGAAGLRCWPLTLIFLVGGGLAVFVLNMSGKLRSTA